MRGAADPPVGASRQAAGDPPSRQRVRCRSPRLPEYRYRSSSPPQRRSRGGPGGPAAQPGRRASTGRFPHSRATIFTVVRSRADRVISHEAITRATLKQKTKSIGYRGPFGGWQNHVNFSGTLKQVKSPAPLRTRWGEMKDNPGPVMISAQATRRGGRSAIFLYGWPTPSPCKKSRQPVRTCATQHRGFAFSCISRAFFACAVLLLSSLPAAAAGPYRPFQSGLWSGGAYTDDRTGKFSHCSAGVVYDGGTDMFVVSTEAHGWWLGFTNPHWALGPSGDLPVELNFDDHRPVEIPGTVASPELLLVPMSDNSQLIDTFRRSSQLKVVARERSFSLGLDGTATVMAELANCVRLSAPTESRSPGMPAANAGAPPPQSPPPALQPAPLALAGTARLQRAEDPAEPEEIKLAKNFLLAARLPNARLIDTDKPPALAGFKAVWKSDDAAGAVKIIPPGPEVSGLAIASELIAVDPQLCKGDFAAARSSTAIDRGMVYSASLSCTDAQSERSTHYFVAPRQKGGLVVFAVIAGYPERSASAVREKFDLFNKAAVQAVGTGE